MPPDYHAAVSAAALFDRSLAGKLTATGADAALFLGNLSTNDIKALPPGGGCEAYFCDPRAKVQFAAWIYRARPAAGGPVFWVETTPGRNADLLQYLDRYLISERVELADRTADFAQFHVAGPAAAAVLGTAAGGPVPDLPEFAHADVTIAGAPTTVRRRDPLGLPGYDLVCPADHAAAVRAAVEAAGAVPGSADTFEVLRVEAGTPVFGPDIDATRFVMEVGGAARAVSYAKGCFLGQEPIVMARDRAGHVNRAFSGLKVIDGGPLPPGTKLLRDGQDVGVVTSSCHSPRLGAAVALGYLKWKHQEPGLRLAAETPDGPRAVEVVGLPPVRPVS